jgi:hypothetical protein
VWSSVSRVFEQDVETLRGAYQAFNEGGVEAFLERLAPEFQLRDRDSSPDRAETRYGKEGIKELFASYMEAFDALRLEPRSSSTPATRSWSPCTSGCGARAAGPRSSATSPIAGPCGGRRRSG